MDGWMDGFLKWHNIINSQYIATPLYMRVDTPEVRCH